MKLTEWIKYVEVHQKNEMTLQDAILAVCEEAGECAGWFKKSVRRRDAEYRDIHLMEELGDVLYYIQRVCLIKGWDVRRCFDACKSKNSRKERD